MYCCCCCSARLYSCLAGGFKKCSLNPPYQPPAGFIGTKLCVFVKCLLVCLFPRVGHWLFHHASPRSLATAVHLTQRVDSKLCAGTVNGDTYISKLSPKPGNQGPRPQMLRNAMKWVQFPPRCVGGWPPEAVEAAKT